MLCLRFLKVTILLLFRGFGAILGAELILKGILVKNYQYDEAQYYGRVILGF